MPAHKSKNFRFRIIDECLQNTSRTWTLEDLIEEVSNKLTDEFGVQKVSKRSIQYDIALMREKPPVGYSAPIVCIDGKYSYSDKDFTIQHSQLSKPDIDNLTEVVNTLKQYKNYSHLGDVLKIIEKIEAIIAINPGPTDNVVEFETSDKLVKGITWLKQIFDAVVQKRVIELTIRDVQESISHIVIHPYFLKEYNSEWYLYGIMEPKHDLIVVPVQKIAAISPQIVTFIENTEYVTEYFKSLIGIHPGESSKPTQVTLKITKELISDFKQSPLHESQEMIDLGDDGAMIHIKVIINKDLLEIILKYGSLIKVEAPDKLRKKVIQELKTAHESYFKLSLF
ncbi:MAG TPA: WYL domain-containing protein [Bacteroidales bacterium]|jgi:predicted DNA-binding transcriptional regulator YafY|nr:WYL domain-containing protein [Bacteroidales bacterium]